MTRALALALALLAALALGLWRRRRDGRTRVVDAGPQVLPAEIGTEFGERATLLQVSAPFCGPCRAARRVLSQVAEDLPGVRHVEVDAEQHLDLVRRLEVLRTPTLLVLDPAGRVVRRASGVPSPEQVRAALAQAGTGA